MYFSNYLALSLLYSYLIYHKLGFEDTDTERLTDGIRFIPMKLKVNEDIIKLVFCDTLYLQITY